jgi:hypothetical protein
MPGGPSIPPSLVQTFRDTVQAVEDLRRGGREVALMHEEKLVSIRYVIEVTSIFQDRMPDDLHAQLYEVAVSGGEAITGNTFAAGARCLSKLYSDTRAKRRANVGNAKMRRMDLF